MSVGRRRPRPPARPRLALEELDYVAGFQDLFRVGRQLRRGARTLPLLLERTRLELGLHCFRDARAAATDAVLLDGRSTEARWLHAKACLGMAMAQLGLVGVGPVGIRSDEPEEEPADLVEEARGDLVHCRRLTQGRDEEADQLLGYLDSVLSARLRGSALAAALRDLVVP